MDFLVFTEGRNELANNGLPSQCWFLLSTKSVDGPNPHAASETLAAANLGELTSAATGYARQSQPEPVAVDGTLTFSTMTWTPGSATTWPNAVRSVVLVTDQAAAGVAICAWNLQPGGAGRDLSAADATENVTPILDLNSGESIAAVVPVGAIMMWPTNVAPAGWLLCQGQGDVSAATYPKLAALLGSTGGMVNMPNLMGRFPLGATASSHGIGSIGGEETTQLAAANVATHTHGDGSLVGANHSHLHMSPIAINSNRLVAVHPNDNEMDWAGSAVNRYDVGLATVTAVNLNTGSPISIERYGVTSSGASDTGISGSTGDKNGNGAGTPGVAHNNMPPFLTVNYIVRAR